MYVHELSKEKKRESWSAEGTSIPDSLNKKNNCVQSSKTANSDARRFFANSPRTFAGIAAPQLLRSLLLGQLPLLALFVKLAGARTTTGEQRCQCSFFAAKCNCSRRLDSSKGGRHLPLRAAGSRLDRRFKQRLHCSMDLSRLVMSRAMAASELSRFERGPMSLPC